MSYLGRSAKLSLKAQEKVSFLATAGQTSKTGLSYVPNFIEVYVNGILLTDTTDFTATNGNSVTFTVALALNDEVTVISLKTFSVADHYTKSEDDALLAAKAPIASPVFTGNVGINNNSPTQRLETNGNAQFNMYDDPSGSGGYYTTKGLQIGNAFDAGLSGGDDDRNAIVWNERGTSLLFGTNNLERLRIDASGHAIIPAGVTLGTAAGVYSAANTLDDYEEGTWSANASQYSVGISTTGAYYRKVGTLVHVNIYLEIASTSATNGVLISGLPFAAAGSNNHSYLVGRSNQGAIICQVNASGSAFDMRLVASDANKTFANMSGSHILISGTYVSA